jgi:hypothetical protein
MDKLCKRLTDTYNTTVLDDVDKTTQAVFYSEAHKHKNGGKGLTTLMELIYNHYKGGKPKPMFIGGPKTLTLHWSDKYQKMIYIFGEWHSNKTDCCKFPNYVKRKEMNNCPEDNIMNPKTGKCVLERGQIDRKLIEKDLDKTKKHVQVEMAIEIFLEDLITNTDAFIDMYFEFPAYKGEKYDNAQTLLTHGDRMERLLRRFETCVQFSQRAAKKCQLARIHYFDVRKEDSRGVHDTAYFRREMQRIFNSQGNKKRKLTYILKHDPRIKKVLDGLNAPTEKEFSEFWEQQVDENPYVQKELGKTSLKDEIVAYMKKTTVEEALSSRDIWRISIPKIFKPKNDDEFVDSFRKTYAYTAPPNARVPDFYTLARIFKEYDTSKPAARGKTCDQPRVAHNIIIYAGNYHSNTYRRFLESIGFEEIAKTESSNEMNTVRNCIDMENFPQPFFSHIPENRGFLAKLLGW